jgi:hypothetical protein
MVRYFHKETPNNAKKLAIPVAQIPCENIIFVQVLNKIVWFVLLLTDEKEKILNNAILLSR